MPGLLTAAIVFGTVLVAELPDNSGLASLVLGTRYRAGGVFAGAAAAFAVHVVLAVTCGSLLSLLPHRIVQIAVAVVFLAGAVLVLRGDKDDDDEVRLKADAAGFWAVAATSFGVILLAELGVRRGGGGVRGPRGAGGHMRWPPRLAAAQDRADSGGRGVPGRRCAGVACRRRRR